MGQDANDQSEAEGGTNDMTSLDVIWNRVVKELCLLQDRAAEEGYPGHVMNPVIGTVYHRETAFGAKVFAAEYRRTGDSKWLQRAEAALAALQEQSIYGGLSEPVWKPRGVQFKKGSIPATALLLDAFWDATERLGKRVEKEDWPGLVDFLKGCYLGHGLFAHDEVRADASRPAAVQNTAAMALLIMERASSKGVRHDFVETERKAVLDSLERGQRSDGFWPYVFPGALQSFVFRSRLLRPGLGTRVFRRRYPGDSSVLFGDAVHHCLVLYCLVKTGAVGETDQRSQAILSGWKWLVQHIVAVGRGGLRFDFEWEPVPTVPRYANFRDTTTYFLILSIACMLAKLGLLAKDEAGWMITGLLHHIGAKLLSEDEGKLVCVEPYDGPPEVVQNIFPRAAESVGWKGALLSDVILESWIHSAAGAE